MISGYLISTIIFENLQKNTFSIFEFYVRRINRILPALSLVMLVVLIAGYFLLVDDEFSEVGKHLAAGSGFVSNLVLWGENGYFNTDAELKPLLHLWSLGVEEQFYLFWPLLVYLFWSARFGPAIVLLIITVISFGLNIYQIEYDSVGTFYSPITRFWELLIGSMLAYVNVTRPTVFMGLSVMRNYLSILGACLITTCFFILDKDKAFPGWWALLPTLGTLLILLSGSQASFNRLLSSRVLVWFGLISFPLYLWHWPLLAFLRILGGDRPSTIQRASAVLMAIFLAWLTYMFLEKPIRQKLVGKRVAYFLLLLTMLIGVTGLIVYKTDGFPYRAASLYSLNNKAIDKTLKNVHFNNGIDRIDKRCKDVLGGKADELYCQVLSNHPKILIVGDSHAISFAYSQVIKENPDVSVVAANGCLPVFGYVGVKANEIFANRDKVCQGLMRDAYLVAKAFPSIQNIIFVNGGTRYLAPSFKFVERSSDKVVSNTDAYINGFVETITKFQELGKKIVLTIDVPDIGLRPENCVEIRPFRIGEYSLRECSIDRKVFDTARSDYLMAISAIHSLTSAVRTYDPTNLFCDNLKCYGIRDNRFYYYDGEHLGLLGSELIFQDFERWLVTK